MFFTGYQPQSSREEFCDDVPNTGQTVVALDMQETELRNMLTEIRLIKDDGSHTQTMGYHFRRTLNWRTKPPSTPLASPISRQRNIRRALSPSSILSPRTGNSSAS